MPQFERSSNVREEFSQRGLMAIVPGIVLIVLGVTFVAYQSVLSTLGYVLAVIGLGLVGYAVYEFVQVKKVVGHAVKCPFCDHKNDFSEPALEDVRCEGCQRMIPIENGRILQVWQVRCGYCNHLNFYSEKSTGLICENCNRVVPISNDRGLQSKATFEHFTVHDDNSPYDLVLTGSGHAHNEELVSTLQQMLALNRNQVKQILDELPSTLLTGVPKKKAELLKAQIEMHGGKAEHRPSA